MTYPHELDMVLSPFLHIRVTFLAEGRLEAVVSCPQVEDDEPDQYTASGSTTRLAVEELTDQINRAGQDEARGPAAATAIAARLFEYLDEMRDAR